MLKQFLLFIALIVCSSKGTKSGSKTPKKPEQPPKEPAGEPPSGVKAGDGGAAE